MATTTIIPLHKSKGRTALAVLSDTADYLKNGDKTNEGEWVSAYECDPLTVAQELAFARSQYVSTTGRRQGANEVVGYHIRQAFKPGEIAPAMANQVGYDLAMSLTKGKFQYIVCTHVDKNHIHNHILLSSVNLDCNHKFRNFKNSAFALRKMSDLLCLQNGLSVIESPKNSRGSYADWLGKKPPTARETLRSMIDAKLVVGQDMGALLAALKKEGCEVKFGKHIAIKLPGSKKNIRLNSLGDDYTEIAIAERLMGTRTVAVKNKSTDDEADRKTIKYAEAINTQNKPNILIDIQAKISEGAGGAYQQWMQIFNLKQAARTLVFLKENGIDSYDDLCEKSAKVSKEFRQTTDRLKVVEARQKSITELQKYMGTYGKTREVYNKYKESGWSEKFYNSNATNIILHKSARKYFEDLEIKKLPPISTLKQEWATLEAERKKLYVTYHEAKDNFIVLATAKSNACHMLGIANDEQFQNKKHDKKTAHNRDER